MNNCLTWQPCSTMMSSESEETITFFLMYQRTTSVCFTVLQAFSNRCTQRLALTCSQFSTWFLYYLSCHSHLKPMTLASPWSESHVLTCSQFCSFFFPASTSLVKGLQLLLMSLILQAMSFIILWSCPFPQYLSAQHNTAPLLLTTCLVYAWNSLFLSTHPGSIINLNYVTVSCHLYGRSRYVFTTLGYTKVEMSSHSVITVVPAHRSGQLVTRMTHSHHFASGGSHYLRLWCLPYKRPLVRHLDCG